MPVKTFLFITSITTAAVGLTLLVFPSFIANFFLPTPAHGTDIFIRFLGSSLIGYTYLNWFTMTHDKLTTMRPTLIGNFSTLFIALVVSIIGVLNHNLKTTGILIILMHLTFASGFGWYLFRLHRQGQLKH